MLHNRSHANERTQSESETDRNEDKVERKNSKKDQDLDKTTKVERKLSTRSVHYEEDQTKPQFKSGILSCSPHTNNQYESRIFATNFYLLTYFVTIYWQDKRF